MYTFKSHWNILKKLPEGKGILCLVQEGGTDPYEAMTIAWFMKEHSISLGYYIGNYGKQKLEFCILKVNSPCYFLNWVAIVCKQQWFKGNLLEGMLWRNNKVRLFVFIGIFWMKWNKIETEIGFFRIKKHGYKFILGNNWCESFVLQTPFSVFIFHCKKKWKTLADYCILIIII